jgi:hypothetical protein
MFDTLQGRLPQELRRNHHRGGANCYLSEVSSLVHNRRFQVPMAEPDTTFMSYIGPDLHTSSLMAALRCSAACTVSGAINPMGASSARLRIPNS